MYFDPLTSEIRRKTRGFWYGKRFMNPASITTGISFSGPRPLFVTGYEGVASQWMITDFLPDNVTATGAHPPVAALLCIKAGMTAVTIPGGDPTVNRMQIVIGGTIQATATTESVESSSMSAEWTGVVTALATIELRGITEVTVEPRLAREIKLVVHNT
jgi:hypothetical protein